MSPSLNRIVLQRDAPLRRAPQQELEVHAEVLELLGLSVLHDRLRLSVRLERDPLLVPADRLRLLRSATRSSERTSSSRRSAPRQARGTGRSPSRLLLRGARTLTDCAGAGRGRYSRGASALGRHPGAALPVRQRRDHRRQLRGLALLRAPAPQPRRLPRLVLPVHGQRRLPRPGAVGLSAGSPPCSCTAAGTTSSATCSSWRSSARTSRTPSGTFATSSSTSPAASWRR